MRTARCVGRGPASRRPPPPVPAAFQVSRPRGMECKVNSRVKEEHPVARSVFLGLELQMIGLTILVQLDKNRGFDSVSNSDLLEQL